MPRLYYCNSIYKYKPIQDVNPLILQKYKDGQVLILCAREQQSKRIAKMLSSEEYPYLDQVVIAYGWWEAEKMGLVNAKGTLDKSELCSYDAVVIISKARIDPLFYPLVESVERFCKNKEQKSVW